ncbi:AAA family ATPase [Microbacterium sp. PF5]|uniref:AAA family ATPase n=1 Tax=Microbacterium sp. PF5 TaxID=2305435 RepID=UPI001444724B|nr:AAA family ATPase [Microbacterium sp. PF5]
MVEAILTRGIPGSGKSTWARSWVAERPDERGRVNRDDIRMAVFGRPHGVDERVVTRVQNATIRALIEAGKDIVVDNTNLNPVYNEKLINFVRSLGANVRIRDFEVDVDEAIRRDSERPNPVGAGVIRGFHRTYLSPAVRSGI